MSEDDLSTKVIYQWLKECGISAVNISIEYHIPLRLGHGQRIVSSRTDVLVRAVNGSSLLVIEVKKPDHKLTNEDKWQAITRRNFAPGCVYY